MPDITMCGGDGCPLKETCYRFLATPSKYRQSFFQPPPYNLEDKKCVYFWKDESVDQNKNPNHE